MNGGPKKEVVVCESQPVTAEGLRSLISRSPDLELLRAVDSLATALNVVQTSGAAVLILDKAFGAQAVLECLAALEQSGSRTAAVVWGISITEAEALRFLQAGAKGVIRKSADLEALLLCLHSVASGATWMEQDVLSEHPRRVRDSGPQLTARERQVVELVGQGLKNREIASELGIRPGTVKVHLKHIFEKTGVRGRFGLALSGLKGKTPRNDQP